MSIPDNISDHSFISFSIILDKSHAGEVMWLDDPSLYNHPEFVELALYLINSIEKSSLSASDKIITFNKGIKVILSKISYHPTLFYKTKQYVEKLVILSD